MAPGAKAWQGQQQGGRRPRAGTRDVSGAENGDAEGHGAALGQMG
jgi:hypothetical protein